jgi:3-oxoacyl-[acyl-carrier protein] reductase
MVAGFDVHLAAVQETLGEKGLALDVDIADSAAVNAAFDRVVAKWGAVDVLVNVAGIGGMDTFPEVPDEAWARVLGVNLNGAFYCSRAAVKLMQAKKVKGSVINISSTSALSGDGPVHYCASKAALMGFTRCLARNLAAQGIRANTIVPGPTNTPMMQSIPKEWIDSIIAGVPMGRMAEPEEIARAALFLASDDAGFVTGQNLAVNGGSAFI